MVEWIDEAITDPPVASDAAVQAAERALRVRFPADFLEVARARQGAEPVPSGVRLPNGTGTGVLHLLHFEEEPGFSNIVSRIFPVQGVLDKGIIPFAEDIGGDLFCFNYRETPETPSVVYWSVDTGTVPIAASFTEFVNKLYDPFA
jgi:hypothetical protein